MATAVSGAFAKMDLFIFTMLLLVLADNYLWLLVGWAGVGLTSYLLIGFYLDRPTAVAAARKAFVMNVIGDWGIMIALFMMFLEFGGVDYKTVFSHARTLPYNGQIITVMALMLLVGPWPSRRNCRFTAGCRTRWKARPRSVP
jgi:NADH-quinone oxidoreductase subunit L